MSQRKAESVIAGIDAKGRIKAGIQSLPDENPHVRVLEKTPIFEEAINLENLFDFLRSIERGVDEKVEDFLREGLSGSAIKTGVLHCSKIRDNISEAKIMLRTMRETFKLIADAKNREAQENTLEKGGLRLAVQVIRLNRLEKFTKKLAVLVNKN